MWVAKIRAVARCRGRYELMEELMRAAPLDFGPIAREIVVRKAVYFSFADRVMLALSTFDTGQPAFAASASFWNWSAAIPGTVPSSVK